MPFERSSAEYLDRITPARGASMDDFEEISRTGFTLGGYSGKKLVFTYIDNGRAMKDLSTKSSKAPTLM